MLIPEREETQNAKKSFNKKDESHQMGYEVSVAIGIIDRED